MSLLYSLFNIGDCVVFTNTQERGWIIFKHPLNTDDDVVKLDIKMQLDGTIQKNVNSNDITVVTYEDLETTNQVLTRSNTNLGLDDDNNVNISDNNSDMNDDAPNHSID